MHYRIANTQYTEHATAACQAGRSSRACGICTMPAGGIPDVAVATDTSAGMHSEANKLVASRLLASIAPRQNQQR